MTHELYEDAVPRPATKRRCLRCAVLPSWKQTSQEVISPTGIVHLQGDHGETGCGIDATGERWWWPL